MAIRSTALHSALTGMTAAHNQLAVTAQNLAKPLFVSPSEFTSASSQQNPAQNPATSSMSAEIGNSLLALSESLTQARLSSATAGAAQAMLDGLLELGRR
ncbi:MAG: hypothetical protein GXX96_22335 [Planctomycetaceae bacterium]|nr:hypothetical protein [Planctomycetaceae bacterium]